MPKKTAKKPQRLILLDAHAILHRAYHALPDFSSPAGEPTGALYGIAAMVAKIVGELSPDYIVACYDLPGPTFRHEAYDDYKAGRGEADDALKAQMGRSRDLFEALAIPIYEKEGFEADDILGTIVEQMKKPLDKRALEIIIASGDMDTLQLVDDKKVMVYTLKKGINDTILYDENAVKERFSFAPPLLTDYKGLRGDPSDNIIGIKGIGEKTATTLITTFGTIEDIYTTLKNNEEAFGNAGVKPRIVTLLKEGEEEALFSKTLASIRRDVPITFTLPEARWRDGFDLEKMKTLFAELGFRTITERIENLVSDDATTTEEGEVAQEEEIDPHELARTALALWVVDSNLTNPTLQDVLDFASTDSFADAKEHVFKELKARDGEKIFNEIEEPLIPILARAHERGILVDKTVLAKLSKKYHKRLDGLTKKIYKEAGREFTINSPKQLSEVLFDSLGLPTKGIKKTPGGVISTRESELEKLRDKHAIIELILEYREVQKLLSTYIDNIPEMLDENDVLHTTFVQSGTTTGRMSSINPNMQNIPSSGDAAKEIRSAFVARQGYQLVALDYSQIEFRVLALLADDEDLVTIFREGRDFHSAVAQEVFQVAEDEVTKEQRRQAKVINFGIIYGMGVTSLQKNLGGSREEAQRFYDTYFDEFPGIARFIEAVKIEARKKGYTETLFGRRRYIPALHSSIPYIRAAAEREAFNAPIQGTATGDIIKLAMIRIDERLRKEGYDDRAFLLLQIHDELIFEIEESIVDTAVALITETMEQVIESAVPLLVDTAVGENWGEL